MKAYLGVTDTAWYTYLAANPTITEANFWRPSGSNAFRALEVGEPFFFKSRYPENQIVGGGFFSGFERLSVSEAWRFFGTSNGVFSLERLRLSVQKYRGEETSPDSQIGCIFLRDIFFFGDSDRIPGPSDFSRNLVQGRGYEIDQLSDDHAISRALFSVAAPGVHKRAADSVEGPIVGFPGLTQHRLGQQAFRAMVTAGYGRRCAVTGERIQPTLQAAHIMPVEEGGQHRLDNGLLLRSDVQILFDAGYLGLDRRHRLRVSPRIRSEFNNGEEFYSRAGTEISLPVERRNRPSGGFIEWHSDVVFLD